MKTWQAILLTLGILAMYFFLPPVVVNLVILGTCIWAAVDSSKIDLYKYKSGIAYKPFVLFIGCVMLWIIGFPWYLSMRYKIKNGLAQLKDQYKGEKEVKKMAEEVSKSLQADEQFCPSCGAVIKKAAEICPKCGVRVKAHEEYRKSKGVAVILALLFGWFSWLYTWKADKAKFIGVLLFEFIVGLIIGAVGGGPYALTGGIVLIWIVVGIAWLWAVILAFVRPQGFYKNY